jgi:hypothetical protein
MSKSILEEAMEDTKLLKETAIENAKNVLVEAISPKIKEFVETQIGESEVNEETNAVSDTDVGGELDMESSGMYEAEEKKDEPVEEAASCEDEKPVDEVVEITNEDLKKAFSEILKSELHEATVTKSFGDVQDPTPKTAGGKGEKGIADEKSGEHFWNDETPPDAKDWTVKEAWYKKQAKVLAGKLAKVQKENSEYKQACNYLKRNLQEVNLFNSKLLYTNKLLQSTELSNKARIAVIEAFDRAQSQREVELVYKSISESLKIAGVIGEGKKTTLKGPKASRQVGSSGASALLKESVEKESGDSWTARQQRLAGLVE